MGGRGGRRGTTGWAGRAGVDPTECRRTPDHLPATPISHHPGLARQQGVRQAGKAAVALQCSPPRRDAIAARPSPLRRGHKVGSRGLGQTNGRLLRIGGRRVPRVAGGGGGVGGAVGHTQHGADRSQHAFARSHSANPVHCLACRPHKGGGSGVQGALHRAPAGRRRTLEEGLAGPPRLSFCRPPGNPCVPYLPQRESCRTGATHPAARAAPRPAAPSPPPPPSLTPPTPWGTGWAWPCSHPAPASGCGAGAGRGRSRRTRSPRQRQSTRCAGSRAAPENGSQGVGGGSRHARGGVSRTRARGRARQPANTPSAPAPALPPCRLARLRLLPVAPDSTRFM